MYIGSMRNSRHEIYGESIFTSFRTFDGKVPEFQEHIKRLWNGAKEGYGFEHLSLEAFSNHFLENLNLSQKFSDNLNHYFRLTLISNGDVSLGKMNFSLSEMELCLSIKPIPAMKSSLSLQTKPSPFSEHYLPIKNGSYFQQLVIKRQAMHAGFDDVLFTREGFILEASTSNIVFEKDEHFYFPAAKGIIQGITEGIFKRFLLAQNKKIINTNIELKEIKNFDHAYLLNCVGGITSVSKINDVCFESSQDTKSSFINFIKEVL